MATLNNQQVNPHDKVYDIAQGYGDVLSTDFNQIEVRFKSGMRIVYDSTGHYGGIRRLYWHDPVVVEPPKSGELWKTLTAVILPLKDYLQGL